MLHRYWTLPETWRHMSNAPRASHQATPTPLRPGSGLHPHPIPRPLTSFIGRERERQELAELIAQSEAQLITLVGPAGVGKTRLALQVAGDMRSTFAIAGFASLAPLVDPGQIVPAAGVALGIREPAIERISEQLGELPTLLVLDNLEQIAGAAATLALLLAACASLIVIATSRAVLRVSGELVYPVLPFDIDPPTDGPLADSPALQLFRSRAHAADPIFALDETTTESVAGICRQVDGLPLAIELAAGQVRVLTPREILSRLDRRFDVLTNGPEDQPERLQSLEHAIRWSYDLLSPAEQRIFRWLGVFSGGFSEDAVSQIALPEEGPALLVLANLIDASLLIRTTQPDGESRYSLLETIRGFCLLELRARGEETVAREAHAAYFLELAARAEPRLIVIGSAEWVRRLTVEYANLRDAVEWSLAAGTLEPVLGLSGTLLSMAYARGEPAESLTWLERAIAMAGPAASSLLSDALFTASALAQVQGDFERSVEHATGSLAVARTAGYPFGEGRALLGLGISAEWAHDLDLAEQRYEAARVIMATLDTTARLAHWRVLPVANLADIALVRGHYRVAIDLGDRQSPPGVTPGISGVSRRRLARWPLPAASWAISKTPAVTTPRRWSSGSPAPTAAASPEPSPASPPSPFRPATSPPRPAHRRRLEDSRDAWPGVCHPPPLRRTGARPLDARSAADPLLAAAGAEGRALPFDDAIAIARAALAEPRRRPARSSPLALSAREREVLACIVEGMHDREIATRLCISPRTVQSHVLGILNKLGARSRPEAVAIALRNDLI